MSEEIEEVEETEETEEGLGELRAMLDRNDLGMMKRVLGETKNPATIYYLLTSGSELQKAVAWHLVRHRTWVTNPAPSLEVKGSIKAHMEAAGLTLALTSSCHEEYYDGTWPLTGCWFFRDKDIKASLEAFFNRSRGDYYGGTPPWEEDPDTGSLEFLVDYLIQFGNELEMMSARQLLRGGTPENLGFDVDRDGRHENLMVLLDLELADYYDDSRYVAFALHEGELHSFTGTPTQDHG